jgi:hypothetical protein
MSTEQSRQRSQDIPGCAASGERRVGPRSGTSADEQRISAQAACKVKVALQAATAGSRYAARSQSAPASNRPT